MSNVVSFITSIGNHYHNIYLKNWSGVNAKYMAMWEVCSPVVIVMLKNLMTLRNSDIIRRQMFQKIQMEMPELTELDKILYDCGIR